MDKFRALTVTLVAILIASLSANIYLTTQNIAPNSADATRVDMTATLSKAQTSISTELNRIGESLVYASEQLSLVGIVGDQADSILGALAANSSFIINAATENLDNVIVAVEPSNWSSIESRNVGEQTYLNPNPYGPIAPVMTPVIPLQSGMMGNAIAAPVFNSDKELIGVVSVIFDPLTLIQNSISIAVADKPYEIIGMQTDGLMVYDSDPAQQWKNMFTDPAYADYTSLLALGHRVADAPSGYGKYTFTLNGSTTPAEKECYWTTVDAYGQEWRLVVIHTLS
ncbi:MAG: hypothetical protein NWE92_04455 [Candidatus Bathyarchaeota archaeon]|nr:hypothetical protein [Candidatus Bathyarchaeota archaeon]